MSYRQLAGAFARLLRTHLLSRHKTSRKLGAARNFRTQAASDERGVALHKKKPAPAKAYTRYIHATEDEHRTAEEKSWVFSKKINTVTALAAIVAALFAGFTWWQTRLEVDAAHQQVIEARKQTLFSHEQSVTARENLINTTRAWMTFSIPDNTVSLHWFFGDLELHFRPIWHVYGPSPAIDVSFLAIVHPGIADYFDADNVCQVTPGGTQTFFAGEQVNINYPSVGFPAQTITDFEIRNSQSVHIRHFSEIPITVAACVRYLIVGDNKPRYFGRVYGIDVTTDGMCFHPVSINVDIPEGSACLEINAAAKEVTN